MRKEARGEERDTTTHAHLIKVQIFTHASRVTKFSTYGLSYSGFQSLWGLYNPPVGSSPPRLPRSPAETKRKMSD